MCVEVPLTFKPRQAGPYGRALRALHAGPALCITAPVRGCDSAVTTHDYLTHGPFATARRLLHDAC